MRAKYEARLERHLRSWTKLSKKWDELDVGANDVPLDDSFVLPEYRSHDDWGPQVIQQGYYFVMGDHRNNSSDSRHWGPVPKKYIVGKVKVRWWPLQEARIF